MNDDDNGDNVHELRPSIELRKASDIILEHTEFLIYPYIPLGEITILEGNPGEGKSRLITMLMAAISNGVEKLGDQKFPNMLVSKPGDVVYFAREDSAEKTIVPNLIRAQADIGRVWVKTDSFYFGVNTMTALDGLMQIHKPKLMVFDPLDSFLPKEINVNANNQMRTVLDPLGKLAKKNNCAIIIVRHFNKQTGGNALYRGAGSMGITGAARSVLQVWTKKDDRAMRYLTHTKSNLAVRGKSLKFKIGDEGLEWHGETAETAEDFATPEQSVSGHSGMAMEEAKEFILEKLMKANEPVPFKSIRIEAMDRGISIGTLYNAGDALRIKASLRMDHSTFKKIQVWELPDILQG